MTRPVLPTIEHIPVMLSMANPDPDVIGFGRIENGKLVIEINHDLLNEQIGHLLEVGSIRELYLGFAGPARRATQIEDERDPTLIMARNAKDQGLSNATIAKTLGLTESTVRTILES